MSGKKILFFALAIIGASIVIIVLFKTQIKDASKESTGTLTPGYEIHMVMVNGGMFETASNRIFVNAFKMGKTEITQKIWEKVMNYNPSRFKGANLPVDNVSWDDVQAFIKKLNHMTGLNYRLPTEDEWEYAAGGSNKNRSIFAEVDNPSELHLYANILNSKPDSVARHLPNQIGLYDMSGNVWEWCRDLYGSFPDTIQSNPLDPALVTQRVYRGGGWYSNVMDCRVGCRAFDLPTKKGDGLGFRLVVAP